MKPTVYIAAPFFTQSQLERINYIELLCDKYNWFDYYSPRKFFVLKPDSEVYDQKKVFDSNLQFIKNSQIMIAIVDEPDTGTHWEMGYAYGIGKQVIMVMIDKDKTNVMLSMSCTGVLKSREKIESFLIGKDYGYAYNEINGRTIDFNWGVLEKWNGKVY